MKSISLRVTQWKRVLVKLSVSLNQRLKEKYHAAKPSFETSPAVRRIRMTVGSGCFEPEEAFDTGDLDDGYHIRIFMESGRLIVEATK